MVNPDAFLFENDKNIQNLWTERYRQIQREDRAEQMDVVKHQDLAFNKMLLRMFTNGSKPSFQIYLAYDKGESQTVNLNNKYFTHEFNHWHDHKVADMRLDKQNTFAGISLKKYASDDNVWQIAAMLDKQNTWYAGYVLYRGQYWCENTASKNSKSGQLGSSKGTYREAGFNRWMKL